MGLVRAASPSHDPSSPPRPIAGGSGWAHKWTLITASRPSTHRRSTAFLLAYSLANAGGTIGYLPLLTLLLPVMIDRIAGNARSCE